MAHSHAQKFARYNQGRCAILRKSPSSTVTAAPSRQHSHGSTVTAAQCGHGSVGEVKHTAICPARTICGRPICSHKGWPLPRCAVAASLRYQTSQRHRHRAMHLLHGHTACMVTRRAWSHGVHGHTACMVTRRAWSHGMHGHTACMFSGMRVLRYLPAFTRSLRSQS
jgi:hypothetical protein